MTPTEMDTVERALSARRVDEKLLDAAAAVLGEWWRTQDSVADEEPADRSREEAHSLACRGLCLLPLITHTRYVVMREQRAATVEEGFRARDAQIDALPEARVRALLKLAERIIAPARDLQHDDLSWVSDIGNALQDYDEVGGLTPMEIMDTEYDVPETLPIEHWRKVLLTARAERRRRR